MVVPPTEIKDGKRSHLLGKDEFICGPASLDGLCGTRREGPAESQVESLELRGPIWAGDEGSRMNARKPQKSLRERTQTLNKFWLKLRTDP